MVLMTAEKKGFWDSHYSLKKFAQVGVLTGIAWIVGHATEYFPNNEEVILFTAVLAGLFNYVKHNWING